MNPMDLLRGMISRRQHDDALVTTPWRWRTSDGMYVGHDGSIWLYRTVDTAPLLWEDRNRKLDVGSNLSNALYELAGTSKDLGVGIRSLSKQREIHLLSLTWEEAAVPPADTPPRLAALLDDTLTFTVPRRALIIGVRLWSSLDASLSTLKDRARGLVTAAMAETTPDFEAVAPDRRVVDDILTRNMISSAPDAATRNQMECWYSDGSTPDASLYEMRDLILLPDRSRIELAAVMSFDTPMMHAPDGMWGMTANEHPAGTVVISVRGQLEPAGIARNRVRKAERKVLQQIDEENATGDLARHEHSLTFDLAQQVENVIAGGEPLMSNTSIVMARRIDSDNPDTYIDGLRQYHGIEVKPLEHRQISALEETLPCSRVRVNPFLQDVSLPMVAYAGLQHHSALGDDSGVFLGVTAGSYVPCYLDPGAAPRQNQPPATLIAGVPGSGKTFAAQWIAAQSAMRGDRTIVINPKPEDSLAGLVDVAGGHIVRLSAHDQPGRFDPFRVTPDSDAGRQVAAEILTQHILNVLGSRGVAGQGFTQTEEIEVSAGIRQGADNGARCARDAINTISNDSLKNLIFEQARDPLFALAIGDAPAESYTTDEGTVLLVEFDKALDLPPSGVDPASFTRSQRIALAAVRLVTRSSLELLAGSDGGVLIVDEAWTFLSSPDGLQALQSLGRLGRSKNILPVFLTQRVSDLLTVDMEGYISRVLAMRLTEEREAEAALKLCGLEPTPERIAWLRDCGAKYTADGQLVRGAQGIHRDLNGNHAAVMIGPVPVNIRQAFSTNPDDRRKARNANQHPEGLQ